MKVSGKLAGKGLHAFDKEPRIQAGTELPRVWVVVADREKAHIYRKTLAGIERIADAKIGHASAHHDEDAGPDSTSHRGHDVRSEKKHHGYSDFIPKLAAWLDLVSKENAFDRLILVASPHTLGSIRAAVSKNIHARITAEVDKDMIRLPEKEIEDLLCDIVWF